MPIRSILQDPHMDNESDLGKKAREELDIPAVSGFIDIYRSIRSGKEFPKYPQIKLLHT
jgi:hypothetical protein